jgi:predicted nucleic acid-binding protein
MSRGAFIIPGKLDIDVIPEDPADNKIIACALEGDADFIISGDHHLTDLKIFQGIKIVDPAAFLKIVNIQ